MRDNRLWKRAAERPLFLSLYATVGSGAVILLGTLLGAYPLPLLQSLWIFPIYRHLLQRGSWGWAFFSSALWALTSAWVVGFLTLRFPSLMESRVLRGPAYRQEMFSWIRTGIGKEGDPSLFLPEHLLHLGLFGFLTLVSGGLLGLLMGSLLMNYMSFYVGHLVGHALHPFLVLLMAWPPWAALRVVAFILLAIPLSALFWNRWSGAPLSWGRMRSWIGWALLLLLADVLLKWQLAPLWQRTLHAWTSIA